MSEPPVLPEPRSATALQIIAQHLSWAALVFYLVTYSHPAEIKWYVEQAAAQRAVFFAEHEKYEARRDAQVKSIELECHTRIEEDFALSQTNHRLLMEILARIEKNPGPDGR